MKMIHLLILLLSFSFAKAQSDKELIRWRDKKLVYADFKGTTNAASGRAALTNTSIKIDMGYGSSGFTFKVNSFFDRTKSWMLVKNEVILQHEQGHFDITELYARKLQKSMKAYKFNANTVSKDINDIYQSIMTEHSKVQEQYDNETDYSRNKVQQDKWTKKIADDLKEYEDYKDY